MLVLQENLSLQQLHFYHLAFKSITLVSIVSELASQGRDVWKALMNILVRFAQIPMLMTNAIDVFSKLGKFIFTL